MTLPDSDSGKPRLILTYPAQWTSRYLKKNYQRIDPVITQARQNPEPFRWGTGLSSRYHSPAQQQTLDEASQFGIRFGFTVPIHAGSGPIAALTFATDQRRESFETCINSYVRMLQLMAMFFHAHARRKLAPSRVIEGILLSPREFECLEWTSRGKSAWEIGGILGISRNTAAGYLDNAKEKLGVRTTVQAAIRLAAAKKEEQN